MHFSRLREERLLSSAVTVRRLLVEVSLSEVRRSRDWAEWLIPPKSNLRPTDSARWLIWWLVDWFLGVVIRAVAEADNEGVTCNCCCCWSDWGLAIRLSSMSGVAQMLVTYSVLCLNRIVFLTLARLSSNFQGLATTLVLQFKGALAAGVVHAAGDCVLVDMEGLQLVLLQWVHARRRERIQIVGRRQRTAAVRLRVDEIAAEWVLFWAVINSSWHGLKGRPHHYLH